MSANHENRQPNTLTAKNPYTYPMNWMPWSEGAFEKAKSENKPIFRSIGYSICHWCHVGKILHASS